MRSPMIPGFNDSPGDVREILRFVTGEMALPAGALSLLKYNKYAEGKFTDQSAERAGLVPQTPEYMERLNEIIRTYKT